MDNDQNNNPSAFLEARQEVFLGPLPPPKMLRQYVEINSEYPERIFRMVEAHVAADVTTKNRESAAIMRGQLFTFGLGCIGFGISALLAIKGLETGAIAAAIGGISPIIHFRLNQSKEKIE
jgi:uncharacterized membrane protein